MKMGQYFKDIDNQSELKNILEVPMDNRERMNNLLKKFHNFDNIDNIDNIDTPVHDEKKEKGRLFTERFYQMCFFMYSNDRDVPGVIAPVMGRVKHLLYGIGFHPKAYLGHPADEENKFESKDSFAAESIVKTWEAVIANDPYSRCDKRDESAVEMIGFKLCFAAALAAERPDVAIALLKRQENFGLDVNKFFLAMLPLFVKSFVLAHDNPITDNQSALILYKNVIEAPENAILFKDIREADNS